MNSAEFITFYKYYTTQRRFFEDFWRSGGSGSLKLECDGGRASLSINISSGSGLPRNESSQKKKPPSKVKKSRMRKEAWLERRRQKPPAEDPPPIDVPAPPTTNEPSPAPDPPVSTELHKHCTDQCKCCSGENTRGSDSNPEEHRCFRPCSVTRADRCCRCSLENCDNCCQRCDGVQGCGPWAMTQALKRCLQSITPKKTTPQEDGPGSRTRQGRLYSAAAK